MLRTTVANGVAAASVGLLVGVCACRGNASSNDAGAHPSGSNVSPISTPSSSTVSHSTPKVDAPRCRIASAEGLSPTANPTSWLTLPDHASLGVRAADSTRELHFRGPAKVRPCGSDVALLVEGTAIAIPSGGQSPGAEEWTATGCGAFRWAAGTHRVTASPTDCTIHVAGGSLHAWLPADVRIDAQPDGGASPKRASSDEFIRIDGPRDFRLTLAGKLGDREALERASERCDAASANVRKLADALEKAVGTMSAGDFGHLAEESVVARGIARAACAVAEVRKAKIER